MVDQVEELCRPIIGIENRTALEAFDIMADRIRRSLSAYNPNERLREALELVVDHERATGTAEEKLASAIGIARDTLARTSPSGLRE